MARVSPCSSPQQPDGRRRRAAAFSYSRVRDGKSPSPATRRGPTTLSLGSSVGSEDGAVNGSNGDFVLSWSEEGTGSSSVTNASTSGDSGAVSCGERGGAEERDGATNGYVFVEQVPRELCCGLCGKVSLSPV